MRVSVIIPCYNVAHYVQRAVESALPSSDQGTEVICVDDGSTDDTRKILEYLVGRHPQRIVVIDQPNKGACAARNTGMERASGEYLQFLDADDELLSEKTTHQWELARAQGFPELVVGSSKTFSVDGDLVRKVIQNKSQRDPWMDVMAHRMNVTSALLWKATAVKAVGGWNEELGSSQEYDLMFRMLKAGARVAYDDAVLTHIHQRKGGSISQTNVGQNWKRFVELRAGILEHVRNNGLATDLKPYEQVLFDSIRTLYPYDRAAALNYYNDLLPANFEPTTSPATGRGYLLLHKLFRFDLANRIRMYLSAH